MPEAHGRPFLPAGPGHGAVKLYMEAKRRPGSGMVAVEGHRLVRHALGASVPMEAVFVCRAWLRDAEALAVAQRLAGAGVPSYEVSPRLFGRMVDRDGPDGIAALGRWRPAELADVRVTVNSRVLVAAGVELPGNLGTLIRAADGAGADAVVVTGGRVRLAHPVVLKASMGTVLSSAVAAAADTRALRWMSSRGFRVIVADPCAAGSYRDADYDGALALVVGNERRGLPDIWRAHAHQVVRIPMHGRSDSLNAAIAGALLLYEALARQPEE